MTTGWQREQADAAEPTDGRVEVRLGLDATVTTEPLAEQPPGRRGVTVTLSRASGSVRLRPVSEELAVALRHLARTPEPLADLLGRLQPADHAQLRALLTRAPRWFSAGLVVDGGELLRLEPVRAGASFRPVPVGPDWPVRLTKFSLLRTQADRLVLESPRSPVRAVPVADTAYGLLGALGRATTARRLSTLGWSVDQLVVLLGHLVGAELVETADPGPGAPGAGGAAPDPSALPSESDPVQRQWDFHDLLFHSRVRSGRFDDALGAVYPYRGAIDPLPVVRPLPEGPRVDLPPPDLDAVLAADPPLTAALEARRSDRTFGAEPVRLEQLSEFLFRVARIRARYRPADGEEVASRPFPSGGGLYELELYLTVRRCAGLDPGIYYYDGTGHRLVLRNAAAADRTAMLDVAARATGEGTAPDVLVTLTSRFQRLAWKYRSIAYATTLRNTGVVYQTMYLVATALGLGGCGLGNGDADLAARVLGLDYYTESSVGEFMLGSLPATGRGWSEPDPQWELGQGADWPQRAVTVVRGRR